MILDSSAIVAVVFREPQGERLEGKLLAASVAEIGAPTRVATGLVLSARLRRDSAQPARARFVQEAGIQVVRFGEAHSREAVEAWLRFGKGRQAASLDFGDCLRHEVARLAGRRLLCVGEDFPETDLELA